MGKPALRPGCLALRICVTPNVALARAQQSRVTSCHSSRVFRSPPRYSRLFSSIFHFMPTLKWSFLYWPVPPCIRNQTYFRTALSIHRTIPGTSDRSLLYSQTAEVRMLAQPMYILVLTLTCRQTFLVSLQVFYIDRSLLYSQTAETDLPRVLAGLTPVRL